MGAYASFARWIGDKPWFRPVATGLLPKVDAVLLKSRGWRATPFPTLLLITTGHRTYEPHATPLYYLEDDGFVVIASNFGRAEPDWSRNLMARPAGTVTVGGNGVLLVEAERVPDAEWEGYLSRFTDFYPPFRDYVGRAERDITIWRLTPA